MPPPQEQFDNAMFDYSQGRFEPAIAALRALLTEQPDHFDAQLALGMALYRLGDYPGAIAEGHKAEQLHPREQLVHTNLSLFYMKAGDKQKAEHHGLQARIAGWRENPAAGGPPAGGDELELAKPKPPPVKISGKLPDMPWKKKKPAAPPAPSPAPDPGEAKPPSA
jgi:tetratricopeptide (TPR) repeat protein